MTMTPSELETNDLELCPTCKAPVDVQQIRLSSNYVLFCIDCGKDECEHIGSFDTKREARNAWNHYAKGYQRAQSEREWIAVSEREPTHYGDIYLLDSHGNRFMGHYKKGLKTYHKGDNPFGIGNITHWFELPLPLPPEGEK